MHVAWSKVALFFSGSFCCGAVNHTFAGVQGRTETPYGIHLIVEDDVAIRKMVGAIAQRHGFVTDGAADGDDAIAKLSANAYEAVVLDLMLPKANGLEVIAYLAAHDERMLRRTLVVTASVRLLKELDASAVAAVLVKPFELRDLTDHLVRCCSPQAHDGS
jgi:DNA-binding response OmpR family regulator